MSTKTRLLKLQKAHGPQASCMEPDAFRFPAQKRPALLLWTCSKEKRELGRLFASPFRFKTSGLLTYRNGWYHAPLQIQVKPSDWQKE